MYSNPEFLAEPGSDLIKLINVQLLYSPNLDGEENKNYPVLGETTVKEIQGYERLFTI